MKAVHPASLVIAAGVVAATHVGKLPPALPALQQVLGVSLVQAGFFTGAGSVRRLAGAQPGQCLGRRGQGTAGLLASRVFEGLAVLAFSMVGGLIPGTLFSLAVRLAPSTATVPTTVGWMPQWSAFGQFCGPPLVAWAAGLAGRWQLTWTVTGACSLIGAGLA